MAAVRQLCAGIDCPLSRQPRKSRPPKHAVPDMHAGDRPVGDCQLDMRMRLRLADRHLRLAFVGVRAHLDRPLAC